MARGNWIYDDRYGPDSPAKNASMIEWRHHLNQEISFMMTAMMGSYGIVPGIHWNEHLISQMDYVRGRTDLDFIGCVYGSKDLKYITDRQLHHLYELTRIPSFVEHDTKKQGESAAWYKGKLPLNFDEWMNVKYLTEHTKEMIRECYREDFELFEFVCGTTDNPDPIF